jgi:NAD(P)H-nitrite reductase large subunit
VTQGAEGRSPQATGATAADASPPLAGEAGDVGACVDPVVCFCNEVPLSAIVCALEEGAKDLTALIDATWAGCGACGGTCQPDLEAIIEDWYADEP